MRKAFSGKAGDPIKSANPTISVPKAKKSLPGQSELFSGLSEPKKPSKGRKSVS